MAGSSLPSGGGDPCLICGDVCAHTPQAISWTTSYPFARGGEDPMKHLREGVDFVYAPHAISDPSMPRKPYGAGDVVPMADAIKYGLVPDPAASSAPAEQVAEKPKRGRRSKRGPAEDRARTPDEDR